MLSLTRWLARSVNCRLVYLLIVVTVLFSLVSVLAASVSSFVLVSLTSICTVFCSLRINTFIDIITSVWARSVSRSVSTFYHLF